MKRFSIILIFCAMWAQSAFGWGQVGHDAVAYIAERNLTPKARKAVEKVLDGHSLVYYASWLDNVRKGDYAVTATWHYANVDEGQTFATMQRNPKGDVVSAVELCVDTLKVKGISDSVRKVYTKYLIHLVGDLHCPMHAGHLSDLGGNRRPVTFFKTQTNLHSVWDSYLPEAAHKWYYTEWGEQLDRCSRKEKRQISEGTPEQWFGETVNEAKRIYEITPENASLSYDYVFENAPVVDAQILKAGYRLAFLLNEIYK